MLILHYICSHKYSDNQMFEKSCLRQQITVKETYLIGMGFAYEYALNVIRLRIKIMFMKRT